MSLTNVQVCSDEQQCFIHITPEQAEKRFGRASISPNAKLFLCGHCHHYVHFISGGANRSHFRHDKNDDDKDCLERSRVLSIKPSERLRKSLCFPMRLSFDNGRVSIQVGFLPTDEEYLSKASSFGVQASIWQNSKCIFSYLVDFVNFSSTHTTFFDAGSSFFSPFELRLAKQDVQYELPPEWVAGIPALSRHGTLFDAQDMKRIPLDGDATVGKVYFLVTIKRLYPEKDVLVEHYLDYSGIKVYKIKAVSFSRDSAAFFLLYHAFLTVKPTQLLPIWPPTIEGDNCVYSNCSPLYFAQEGTELRPRVYPEDFRTRPVEISARSGESVPALRVNNDGEARMIWSTHADVAILRYMFLRKQPVIPDGAIPQFELKDTNGISFFSGVWHELPAGSELILSSLFDGKIRYWLREKVMYCIQYKGDSSQKISKLEFDSRLEIWIGPLCIACLEFEKPGSLYEMNEVLLLLENTVGRYVPFPRRYGMLLSKYSQSPSVQAYIKKALSAGKIRLDALRILSTHYTEV